MLVDYLLMLMVLVPSVTAIGAQLSVARLRRATVHLSVAGSVITFIITLSLFTMALFGAPSSEISFGIMWGVLLFDPLSSLMAFVIATISMLVHLYSRRYMAEERGYSRFFILLGLMTSALLLMVSAGDLVTLLIAWHLIGVLLYFLLGHDATSHEAHRFASWTLLTYRFGDLPLLLAAVLLFQAFDTWSLQSIFTQLLAAPDIKTLFGLPLAETVAALVALSAFARSAQFLLHTWLPYSMGGPTPVSALMHAGIVNAGGFLINRFAPLFLHTDLVLHWVFVVGLVTAVIGSVLMLAQNDIKKALGYSTMGQMGFMIMECGVGAFSLAIYHLIAHGLFKGTLFLSAGGVINHARQDDGVPKDDLYTFVVERRPARLKRPWIVMAAVTLIVPVVILTMAHLLVAGDYFHQQGAVVLLFFGWVTGAQLIFATYRIRTENIWRLMGLILVSFTIVVLGYAFISHAFELFLYPNDAIRSGIYEAAGIDIFWFDVLVIILTLMVVIGWLAAYYTDQHGRHLRARAQQLRQNFYTLLAREFFMVTLYRRLSGFLLGSATRLNVMLRWY
jgi:NADH-quinone oxidoreductase subunit L